MGGRHHSSPVIGRMYLSKASCRLSSRSQTPAYRQGFDHHSSRYPRRQTPDRWADTGRERRPNSAHQPSPVKYRILLVVPGVIFPIPSVKFPPASLDWPFTYPLKLGLLWFSVIVTCEELTELTFGPWRLYVEVRLPSPGE